LHFASQSHYEGIVGFDLIGSTPIHDSETHEPTENSAYCHRSDRDHSKLRADDQKVNACRNALREIDGI
jgi:ribosomal protein S14